MSELPEDIRIIIFETYCRGLRLRRNRVLESLSLTELREILLRKGLATRGAKKTLISRLVHASECYVFERANTRGRFCEICNNNKPNVSWFMVAFKHTRERIDLCIQRV